MVVKDVREQFKDNPGIMAGTSKPDYARCVHIVTGAALKEMVLPGILAVGLPVAVGLIFRHFSDSYQAGASLYGAGGAMPMVPMIAGKAVNLAGAEAVAGLLMRSGVHPAFRQIGLPDEFLDAGALPTLHDRYGISAAAVAAQIKGWL